MVERDLAKVEVAGSTPVSRSSGVSLPTFPCQEPRLMFHIAHQARYPSGKGEVCKTFMRRFDPDPRLQPFFKKSPSQEGFTLANSWRMAVRRFAGPNRFLTVTLPSQAIRWEFQCSTAAPSSKRVQPPFR